MLAARAAYKCPKCGDQWSCTMFLNGPSLACKCVVCETDLVPVKYEKYKLVLVEKDGQQV
jgi:hypothetical protein